MGLEPELPRLGLVLRQLVAGRSLAVVMIPVACMAAAQNVSGR